jgi:3-methyladenine DNA glycosylase AlkD
VAKKYSSLPLKDIEKLLESRIHEHRLTGLLILVNHYKTGDKREVYEFYLKNLKGVNNWDLVDLTAPNIVGSYLLENPNERKILYRLAKSSDLWERRVAIISTSAFIRGDQYEDTLKISEILLKDKHDLIHKAVGWMLRELGKRSLPKEEEFLKKHVKEMPRTMLRYAIERFPEEKRKYYMSV